MKRKNSIIGSRCIDMIFDNLVRNNPSLKEQKVARFLPIIGFTIELILEILGIFLVYFLVDKLAPIIVGKNFNNNFLYSMVFLPVIGALKHLPDIAKSIFVRIAISDEYIICKRGYFRKFIDELYVKHIDNIEVRTTIWGEWFNYGNITLYSFGGKITIPFLKNPYSVYILLKRKMRNRQDF